MRDYDRLTPAERRRTCKEHGPYPTAKCGLCVLEGIREMYAEATAELDGTAARAQAQKEAIEPGCQSESFERDGKVAE